MAMMGQVPTPQQIREIELRLDQNRGNLESMDEATLWVRLAGLQEEVRRAKYWIRRHRTWHGDNSSSLQLDQEQLEQYEAEAEQVKEQLKKRERRQ